MQEGQNARQQVVERIRQSTSILVAVGNNPSVDALAASLGLSLMLNKMNKHTTAVFSGQTPPALQFLEPNKTFESNVDALRDFIISLDKEKADRLRYKVEDDVVRIFITPYKTSISEKDLQFSQGDFNVDLIIALGVEKRDELDKAIVAHGRILHDATVVTINANSQKSSLGAIDWNDAAASSLCEMLVGMSETFQQPGLLDTQISTALLTGIVAATDRFSNPRTSPRVMTMAAQLMAAGANQQLIATNLQKAQVTSAPAVAEPSTGPVAKQQASAAAKPMQEEPVKKKEPGELDITHDTAPELPKAPEPPVTPPAPMPPLPPTPPTEPTPQEKELEAALPAPQVQHNLLGDLQQDLESATTEAESTAPKAPGSQSVNAAATKPTEDHDDEYISSHSSWKGKRLEPPTLGGTLNATTEEAMEANQKAEDADRNKKLLNHPDDTSPVAGGRRRGKRGKDKDKDKATAPNASPVPPAAAAVAPIMPPETPQPPLPPAPEPMAPEPPAAAATIPMPQPAPTPAPAPEPPVPALPPLPPAPELPPAPLPAPEPAPIPAPAPAPEPTPEPVPAPPEPAPMPTPPAPAPDLGDLQKEVAASAAEAAAAAQPAQSAAGDINSARQAVSEALDAQPFSPAGQPLASVGAQPMPAMPDVPVTEPPQSEPSPATVPPQAPPPVGELPPMPPMPPLPSSDTALPPAPDLPGLNAPLPPMAPPQEPANQTPPTPPPAAPPADPGQFKIPGAA